MEMDWKNITLYPELIVDIVIYVVIATVLIIVSKWVWEEKELRRMKKETEAYHLRMEDQAIEEAGSSATDAQEESPKEGI